MTGTLEVIAGAYITKDILKRLLGPSADYLGGELKNAVEAAHKNISEIIKKALRKSGDNLKEDGSVPPRVVGEIAFKGSFIEDDLMREYFGGLLAASRTSQGDDERAVPMLKLVEQMSIFQLRFHYLCYWFVNHLFQDADVNIGEKSARHTLQIFIPFKAAAIALKVNKRKDWNDIVSHSIMGLEQHQLIDADATKAGRSDVFPTSYGSIVIPHGGGIIIQPNLLGAELFLWAHGVREGTGRVIFKVYIDEDYLDLNSLSGVRNLWQFSLTKKKEQESTQLK